MRAPSGYVLAEAGVSFYIESIYMLGFARFIAQGFSRTQRGNARVSATLLRLSICAVALSVGIMLVSTAIILGFKRQISTFAYSQTGHISLYPWGANWASGTELFPVQPELISHLSKLDGVQSAYPLLQQTALLKTEADYEGVFLLGADSGFHHPFFSSRISQGRLPNLSIGSSLERPTEILLPDALAQTLNLKLGDKVHLYFFGDKIRLRPFILVGLYQSAGIQSAPLLCSSESIRRIIKAPREHYHRIMVMLSDESTTTASATLIGNSLVNSPLIEGVSLGISTAEELVPDMFHWLNLLDSNVYLLLVLMLAVGGFSMITAVVIIVLDRVRQIGILKAIGANNTAVSIVFALLASRLILWGLMWGNLLALLFCILQMRYQLIPLDPKNYFMDAVPIQINIPLWVGINGATFILILLLILLPSRMVSKIDPSTVMRVE